jgi:hypothetical protein
LKRADGDRLRGRAKATGVPVRQRAIDAARKCRRTRVVARNAQRGPTDASQVSPGAFDAMDAQFEPPTGAALAQSLGAGG